jgi:pilus assembly protein FimV
VENRFEALNSGEVLSVDDSLVFLTGHGTFKIAEFTKILKEKMLESGDVTEDKLGWLTEDGIKCEALRFGSTGWQKGKVRLHLEFSPDEPSDVSFGQKKTETVVSPPKTEAKVTKAVEPEPDLFIEESSDFTASVMEEETESLFEESVEEGLSLDDAEMDFGSGEVLAEAEMGEDADFFGAAEDEEVSPSDDLFGEELAAGDDFFAAAEDEEVSPSDDLFGEELAAGDDFFGATEEEETAPSDDLFGEELAGEDDFFAAAEDEEVAPSNDLFGGDEEETGIDDLFGGDEESLDLGQSIDNQLDSFDTGGESFDFGGSGDDESFNLGGFEEEESLDFGDLGGDSDDLFGSSDDDLFGDSDDSDDNLFGDEDIDDVWKDMQDLS